MLQFDEPTPILRFEEPKEQDLNFTGLVMGEPQGGDYNKFKNLKGIINSDNLLTTDPEGGTSPEFDQYAQSQMTVQDRINLSKTSKEPILKFDEPASPKHDWGTLDARDLSIKKKTILDLPSELVNLDPTTRNARLAVGAAEGMVQFVGSLPMYGSRFIGFLNAVRKGELSQEEINKRMEEMTPDEFKKIADMATFNTPEAKTVGNIMGEGWNTGAGAVGNLGLNARAMIGAALSGSGTSGARQRAEELHQQIDPFMNQITEAAGAASIGMRGSGLPKRTVSEVKPQIDPSIQATIDANVEAAKKVETTVSPDVPPVIDPEFNIPKTLEESQAEATAPNPNEPLQSIYPEPINTAPTPADPSRLNQFIPEKSPANNVTPTYPDTGIPFAATEPNHGFGPEVTAKPDTLNPYMAQAHTEIANAEPQMGPGIGGMEYRELGTGLKQQEALRGPTGVPTTLEEYNKAVLDLADKVKEQASEKHGESSEGITRASQDVEAMQRMGPVEAILKDNPKGPQEAAYQYNKGLYNSITTRDAVNNIVKNVADPDLVDIAKRVLAVEKESGISLHSASEIANAVREGKPLAVLKKGEALGVTRAELDTGRQQVWLRSFDPQSLHPITILHEAIHTITNAAFDAVKAFPGKYPKSIEYVRKITALLEEAKATIKKTGREVPEAWLESPSEFNSYALTEPVFKELLSIISSKTTGKSIFDKFKSIVNNLLGKPKDSIYQKLLDATNDWEGINKEVSPEVHGQAIRANGNYNKLMKDRENSFMMHKINGLVSPASSMKEAMSIRNPNAPRDISAIDMINPYGARGKFAVLNQLAATYGLNHPEVTYFTTQIQRAIEWTNKREYETNENFKHLTKLPEKLVGRVLAVEQELQKPAWQEKLKATGSASDAQLKELGLNPDEIQVFRLNEQGHAKEWQRNAESLAQQFPDRADQFRKRISYAPVSHGTGDFPLTVKRINPEDGKETVVYTHRFDTWKELNSARNSWDEANKANGNILSVKNETPINTGSNTMALIDLNEFPDVVSRIMTAAYAKMDAAKKTFELQRSPTVGGAIQYIKDSSGNIRPDPRLYEALKKRLKLSNSLDMQAATYTLIKELESSGLGETAPRIHSLLSMLLEREIGRDVRGTSAKNFEEAVLHSIGIAHKGALKVEGLFNKELDNIPPLDVTVSPRFLKNSANMLASSAVSSALLLNVRNMIQNLLTPFTNPISPFLDAMRIGANPMEVAQWAIETNFHAIKNLTDLRHGLEGSEFGRFIKEQYKRGNITNHQFNEISDFSEGFHNQFIKLTKTGMEKARQYTSDYLIEIPTNIIAYAFSHGFVEKSGFSKALQEMGRSDIATRFDLTREFAKSWTASYRSADTPVGFSQFGEMGRLASTFSRWNNNQVGRFNEGLSNLRSIGNNATLFNRSSYLIAQTAFFAFMAGLVGVPGVASYDAIVNKWNEHQDDAKKKLPNFDAVLYMLNAPSWLHKVPANELTKNIVPEGIDVGSGMKFNSTIEQSIFPMTWFHGMVGQIMPVLLHSYGIYDTSADIKNHLLDSIGSRGFVTPNGLQYEDLSPAINASPTLVKGFLKEKFLQTQTSNPNITAINNKGGNVQYTQDANERLMNKWMGVESSRQKDEEKLNQFSSFYRAKQQLEVKDLHNSVIEDVVRGAITTNKNPNNLAYIQKGVLENAKELLKLQPNGLNNIEQEVVAEYMKQTMTGKDRINWDIASHSNDFAKLKQDIELLNRLKTAPQSQ